MKTREKKLQLIDYISTNQMNKVLLKWIWYHRTNNVPTTILVGLIYFEMTQRSIVEMMKHTEKASSERN